MKKYLKTSEYAKKVGLHYRTVVRHFKNGWIDGYQDPNTGTMFLLNPEYKETQETNLKVVLYARVSSSNNTASLDGQIERLRLYAAAKGYEVIDEVKEIASGLNDSRPKLSKILDRSDWGILLVEHKDRLTRFGFNYFKYLEKCGQKIEVINVKENKDEELIDDFVSIITSFCGRIYGANRNKKTKSIIDELNKK